MIQGTDKIQDFIREASSLHVVNVVFFSALIVMTVFLFGAYRDLAAPYLYIAAGSLSCIALLNVIMHTSKNVQERISNKEFDLILSVSNVSVTYFLLFFLEEKVSESYIISLAHSFLPATLFVLIAPLTWKKYNFVYVGFFGFLEWVLLLSVVFWGGFVLSGMYIKGDYLPLYSNIMVLSSPFLIRTLRQRHLLKLQEKMHKELYTDPLTKTSNRKHFYDFYDKLRESNKHKNIDLNGLGIIFVDIDFFKQYNDHYGHEEGDNCLFEVASYLDSIATRLGLHLFRFGGEEFLLCGMMKESDWNVAVLESEDIKKWGKGDMLLPLPHIASDFKCVTLSAGVDFVNRKDIYTKNAVGIIKKADELLYRAKKSGRNIIVID